jgi:TonB family protein
MRHAAGYSSLREPWPDGWATALSLTLSVAVSWLIFFGLSRVQVTHIPDAPPPMDDIREIALPVEPPPPVIRPIELPPVLTSSLIVLESGRTQSEVKLPALPLPMDTAPRVFGTPRIDFSVKAFKPAEMDSEFETRHVFDRHEVDQPCVPLVKVRPQVVMFVLRAAERLRVTYVFIVNRDGSVEGLKLLRSSGNVHLDKACAQALIDWKFAPAIRRGRTVRQWVQQSIVFKIENGSPFEL